MTLTIYGDFNCPFSALASARADVLLAAESHQIDWRAIQHDTTIPAAGELVDEATAAALAAEIATILKLSDPDLGLLLRVPPRAARRIRLARTRRPGPPRRSRQRGADVATKGMNQ